MRTRPAAAAAAQRQTQRRQIAAAAKTEEAAQSTGAATAMHAIAGAGRRATFAVREEESARTHARTFVLPPPALFGCGGAPRRPPLREAQPCVPRTYLPGQPHPDHRAHPVIYILTLRPTSNTPPFALFRLNVPRKFTSARARAPPRRGAAARMSGCAASQSRGAREVELGARLAPAFAHALHHAESARLRSVGNGHVDD